MASTQASIRPVGDPLRPREAWRRRGQTHNVGRQLAHASTQRGRTSTTTSMHTWQNKRADSAGIPKPFQMGPSAYRHGSMRPAGVPRDHPEVEILEDTCPTMPPAFQKRLQGMSRGCSKSETSPASKTSPKSWRSFGRHRRTTHQSSRPGQRPCSFCPGRGVHLAYRPEG